MGILSDEDETFMGPEEPADDDVSIPDTSQGKSFAKAVGSHGVDFMANSAHGVVLRRIKEVTLVEVLKAFSKYVNPQLITHADNLGAANWAVWLKDSESFDKVMRADSLSFGAASVKLYAYANPIRRVIIRGVPPFVNDAELIACFSKFGELRGHISHQGLMNAGEEFAHIKSFTRVLELAIPKGVRVPDVVKVKANGKEYNLRVQIGAKKYYKCARKGHVSANCTYKKPEKTGQPLPSNPGDSLPSNQVDSLHGNVDPIVLPIFANPQKVTNSTPSFKRRKTIDFQDIGDEEVSESDTSQRSSSQSRRRTRAQVKSRTSDPKPQTISEWGFEKWKDVNLEMKSVTKDRFILFLRSLRRENNNIKCKYVNLGQEIFMTTRGQKHPRILNHCW
ncbi:hypothetical protein Fcan01_21117 [Folsomia candida]|uniref:Uncharacterized protein n=1 Tax=Folsomia candida TaxID=158441 RepID=A0A226DF07_FOLCA|nr:hypothetical protein Fcan01_21117 [Folsomia candida]